MEVRATGQQSNSQLALKLDELDTLSTFRSHFYLPEDRIYLDGNSLGPLSRDAEAALFSAMDAWREQAIGAWLNADPPWYDLTAQISAMLAPLIGADSSELVIAN